MTFCIVVLAENPIKMVDLFPRYMQFKVMQNNRKQRNFLLLIGYISKSESASFNSFSLSYNIFPPLICIGKFALEDAATVVS